MRILRAKRSYYQEQEHRPHLFTFKIIGLKKVVSYYQKSFIFSSLTFHIGTIRQSKDKIKIMQEATKAIDTKEQFSSLSKKQGKNVLKLIENNYQHNLDSNYTEKIEKLDQEFNYNSNKNHYWNEPELSLLYGTELYEAASPSQKLTLNHLYWTTLYKFTAVSETETIHYNQITAGCFSAMGGDYETVARQLIHESLQERSHIHSFYNITHQTMKALLGKQAFINPLKQNLNQHSWASSQLSTYQYSALHFIGKMLLKGQEQYYSQYLKELEDGKKLSTFTNGILNWRGLIPQSLIRFFAFNWGSSPFLASQYYIIRYLANLILKNIEHSTFAYFKKLQQQCEFVPVPTAISYYHFLDESFHTTTSLFLARDLYKNLPKPTTYEKTVVNMALYFAQCTNNTISAIVSGDFSVDSYPRMGYIYKLLQSPVFDMSAQEALQWMEKCFCQEHEGFHITAKSQQRLLVELRRFYSDIDHLWPVNREMRIMASGSSISKAIQNNIKTFKEFSSIVAQSS